jgi:hypothetical protein
VTNRLLRAGIAVIALLAGCAIAGPAGPAAAAGPVPYTDPAVTGSLGLCDGRGHQLTTGSTATQPFAASAVASVAAPDGYAGTGRGAVLYAFQPIENVPADAWSGEELTGNSTYSNAAHPMTAATGGDPALQNFVSDYPTKWDGLVQLRLYLTAPGRPIDSTNYTALDIKISGTTWQAVDGGSAACTAGTAVSVETKLLPKSALRTPSPAPAAADAGSDPSGDRTVWVLAVLGAFLALLAGGWARLRARRHTDPASTSHDHSRPALQGTSEKGR